MPKNLKNVWRTGLEQAHLSGTAYDVLQGEARPVDGVYEVSTIRVDFGRHETVAFKLSGIGPEQIEEPYKLRTLTVRAAS